MGSAISVNKCYKECNDFFCPEETQSIEQMNQNNSQMMNQMGQMGQMNPFNQAQMQNQMDMNNPVLFYAN